MKYTPESIYSVGDTVRIVDQPYDECPFLWVPSMDKYCGAEAVIDGYEWSLAHECYSYHISIDIDNHLWCVNCFEGVEPELNESDSDISVLLS